MKISFTKNSKIYEDNSIFEKIKINDEGEKEKNVKLFETITLAEKKVKVLQKMFDPGSLSMNKLKQKLVFNFQMKKRQTLFNNSRRSIMVDRDEDDKSDKSFYETLESGNKIKNPADHLSNTIRDEKKKSTQMKNSIKLDKSFLKGLVREGTTFKAVSRLGNNQKFSLSELIERNAERKVLENKMKLKRKKNMDEATLKSLFKEKEVILDICNDDSSLANLSLNRERNIEEGSDDDEDQDSVGHFATFNQNKLSQSKKFPIGLYKSAFTNKTLDANNITNNLTTTSFMNLTDNNFSTKYPTQTNKFLQTMKKNQTLYTSAFTNTTTDNISCNPTSRSDNIKKQLHELIIDCAKTDRTVNSHFKQVNNKIEKLIKKENGIVNEDQKEDYKNFGSLIDLKEKLRKGFFTYNSGKKGGSKFVTMDKSDVMNKFNALNSLSERSSHTLKNKLLLDFGMRRINSDKEYREKLIELTMKKSERIVEVIGQIHSRKYKIDQIVKKHREKNKMS